MYWYCARQFSDEFSALETSSIAISFLCGSASPLPDGAADVAGVVGTCAGDVAGCEALPVAEDPADPEAGDPGDPGDPDGRPGLLPLACVGPVAAVVAVPVAEPVVADAPELDAVPPVEPPLEPPATPPAAAPALGSAPAAGLVTATELCGEWSPDPGTTTATPTAIAVAETAAEISTTVGDVFMPTSIGVSGDCHHRFARMS
ncbi:hypothetical protein GCM10009839_90610 [Catenulispora yoronensis]|uniref:Uncharacterized protein n=1 Tax=Catenulispora yoronensis TaxID=450799 RepID=A0ABP5H4V5_9ACTN